MHYLEVAKEAAQTAGELLRAHFEKPLTVNATTAHDIKLEVDVLAQNLITKILLERFPEHALYGEEGIVGDQSSDHQWVVDPLDGTVNFFYGIPHFCVSIALRFRDEVIVGVIYDPIRNELWSGEKGQRPLLNGKPVRVSPRATLAEAVVSIGLAKTSATIDAGLPLLEQMVHRQHDLNHRCWDPRTGPSCGRLNGFPTTPAPALPGRPRPLVDTGTAPKADCRYPWPPRDPRHRLIAQADLLATPGDDRAVGRLPRDDPTVHHRCVAPACPHPPDTAAA